MKRALKTLRSSEPVRKTRRFLWLRRFGMLMVGLLLFSGTGLFAQAMMDGSFSDNGNRINYNGTGFAPNANFTVDLTHVEWASGNLYDEQSNGDGEIEGSGTTGDQIPWWHHVKIEVLDEDCNMIAVTIITREPPMWWVILCLLYYLYLLL